MTMMIIWAAVFISYGISGSAMDYTDCEPRQFCPLDMAPDSVDDMYLGCKDKMKKQVQIYLENEKNNDKTFKKAWEIAKKYTSNWPNDSDQLGKEQAMAIHAYTLNESSVYGNFNVAVREQRFEYNKTFKYHALHFFLTDALQTLNTNWPASKRCVTTFRRTDVFFNQDVVNTEFRFGQFASSSIGSYSNRTFGNKSCFVIFSCFGASISSYSAFLEEREVLIPPYEVFKVTDIKKIAEHRALECEVEYTVNSTRKIISNANCALFPTNKWQQGNEQYVTVMTVFACVFHFLAFLE